MSEPFELPVSLTLTVNIVSAFVGKNATRPDDLPALIAAVNATLSGLGSPPAPVEQPAPVLKPAVSIRKSVTHDHIISLEDGRRFKSMKRYLAGLGMTPREYRAKWSLPEDYPMVAPAYAARRSELARRSGLGGHRRATDRLMPQAASSAEPATLAPESGEATA